MFSANHLPRLYQDQLSYRPRHANIGVNSDFQFNIPDALPARPKNFNSFGREVSITLNTFNVASVPDSIVFQYDVNFTGDAKPADYTKRVLLKKIWQSRAVKAALGEPNNLWIWDGNKLAW
jgi:eukaryotic translation initiation factor 2C|tara:strand:+ start:1745 stop:2107 length:363 start_codon:yes stop_codon:yes gene_type:complete